MSTSPDLPNGHFDHGDASDIFKASSIAEIHATLAHLNRQEASVTARLDSLIASQKDLSRELGRLDLLRAHLGSQVVTTRSISQDMLGNASSTATRISSAVRRLDLEQSRVKATLDVVEQVAELKVCVLGVVGAMGGPQDWEKAAGYLSRASKVPKDILNGPFAEEIVPTAEVPDPPSLTLDNAAESLCGLFLREFEKAAKDGDGAKVTRFFKLFPLVGRSDVGLDVYGRYVCQGVASRARSNLNAGTGANQRKEGFFYANALTKLFEHIAQIVDGHGALVERHYGAGRMVRVIERLQSEADVQGGIILDTWSDERNIDRRLTDIKSYAFSFLVQSFLPPSRGSAGTPRSNSPAVRDGGTARRISTEEQDGVDMKEVDALLSEAAVMLGRWSLYCRFVAVKCRDPPEPAEDGETPALSVPPVLADASLTRKVADRLISPFNAMTTFFFRRSVEKAFQLDEPPAELTLDLDRALPSNAPHITSCVDDVMYIVDKVLQRALATSQRGVVTVVVPTIGRVLGSDFVGMIQRKLRDESYPKPAVQGGQPPEDKVVAFLVLLNNLDVATDYIARIVAGRVEGGGNAEGEHAASPLPGLFPFDHDAVFVTNALHSLQSSFAAKTGELIADGLHVTFERVVKPRLRPLVSDAFRDADYLLASSPASPSASRTPSPEASVIQLFSSAWDALLQPLARLMTPANYTKLLATTVTHLATKVLEKRLWSLSGRVSPLGAVRLERDVSGLVGAVARGGRYGLRDAFLRCTQICLICNMEEDEWEELEGGEEGEGGWVLSKEERARARGMVVRDERGD
ncbi:MAG: hypothetical protein M1832_001510 [Thelocarpon impressellum]|nr:MAG: hypothetical protein M1832_001510 [Thelocarpon impressellum]